MSREETIAFVERLYTVTGAGDWAAAADMLTEDFVAYEADSMPMAGAYRGKTGLYDLFVKVMTMVDVVGLDRSSVMAEADCAIAVITMRFADPSLAPAELCEMFRFRDTKCCEIKPFYYDPAQFAAACDAKRASA
ncbi:nuclear transport factor 2 family protein [Sphingomonas populi]|uniref:Nuclear transport factor 2 family protein n=2 Tax=Sphingomonas populi TaxID=2484750 RepID=A0A4V2DCZ7_9SPHN|nr:nuclear transport factor 2 family protein [Sphingomonas populi]RZF63228.1 nuclear transport factor 2 family protein [Sphingomonas populi]